MDCKYIEDKLIFYITGECTTEKRSEIESHIPTCTSCAKHLNRLKQILSVVDEQKVYNPDPFFQTRIFQKMKKQDVQPQRWFVPKYLIPLAQGALVAASVVAGIFIGVQHASDNNIRTDYIHEFAQDYYLFETEYEPLETIMFNDTEE